MTPGLSPSILGGADRTWESVMNDRHSRAHGLAHSAIIVELLKALLERGLVTRKDVHTLLTKAGQSLVPHGAETARAAAEHVKMIGEAVGVSR